MTLRLTYGRETIEGMVQTLDLILEGMNPSASWDVYIRLQDIRDKLAKKCNFWRQENETKEEKSK